RACYAAVAFALLHRYPPHLHSFPTRRSSDLLQSLVGGARCRVGVGRLRLDRAAAASPEFREVGYFDKLVAELGTESRTDPSGERYRKSTRLNSSHVSISYAVFCLKKKKRQMC